MLGLLSGLDEDQKRGLLMAAASMLQSKGNFGNAAGAGLMNYVQGADASRALRDRRSEEAQQRQMREMQMQEMQRRAQEQAAISGVYGRNTMPGNLAPNDDEGNPMPAAPQGMNLEGLKSGLMAAGPAGLREYATIQQAFAKDKPTMHALSPGQQLFDSTGRQIAAGPEKAPEMKEVKSGNKIHTYERQGDKWVKVAEAPLHKPEGPEKPPAPQLYETPSGPMWVTPPGRGAANAPVTGPDGQPLPGKKREQQLTEAQSRGTLFLGQMREAEKALSAAPIDPATAKGQAEIAAALRAKEAGPVTGTALNVFAGKGGQQYAQAAEQWAEAFLRIKTGAASTRDEVLRNVRTFFPQPGDNDETIKQKNSARAVATKQMEIIAGHGASQLEAQEAPPLPPNQQTGRVRRYNPKTGRIE